LLVICYFLLSSTDYFYTRICGDGGGGCLWCGVLFGPTDRPCLQKVQISHRKLGSRVSPLFSSHTLPSLGVLVGGDHTTKFIVSRPQLGQMKMEVEVLPSRPISMLQKTRRRQKRRKMSTRKEVKWQTGTTVAEDVQFRCGENTRTENKQLLSFD
jgi:hypothetical protein